MTAARKAGRLALLGLVAVSLATAPAAGQDGAAVYGKYCSQCHGDNGDGQGVAAPYLKPWPRDFTAGKYKIRSTPTGGLPTDADLHMVIREGLPYTAMPAFPNLSDAELDAVVQVIQGFSPDFEDPEAQIPPIAIPDPPQWTEERAERGLQVYGETGCGRCHGDVGRGDGMSAPTLTDDWGQPIRVADLTMPWTFRGGGTRRDIFRTMSTGFNGTPMPGFHGALPEEDIWAIVDYIASLSGNTVDEPYQNLVRSVPRAGGLELEKADELFAEAPKAMFRVVGQVVQPGRHFQPSIYAIGLQAVHNRRDIAFRVSWHDMRAETTGVSGPDLEAPSWGDVLTALGVGRGPGGGSGDEGDGGDIWGGAAEESSDPWGDAVADDGGSGDDVWGDAVADDAGGGDDVWGDAVADEGSDDIWGQAETSAPEGPTGPRAEFADAVALQFPLQNPSGVRLPYFLLGDSENGVQLWFADLAAGQPRLYSANGSDKVVPGDAEPPEMIASYDQGEWSVVFKSPRRVPGSGLEFADDAFVPLALTVWDGFMRDRGNRRGLTPWYYVHVEPIDRPSPVGPMVKAGVGVLAIELLLIGLVRFAARRKRNAAESA